jgi:hypothetical protein
VSSVDIDRSPKHYLKAEDVDQLARQNTQLMTELWIVKDRLAVLEAMLVEKGLLAEGAIDDNPPQGELAQKLDRERERYIRRIVGIPPEERSIDSLKALGSD